MGADEQYVVTIDEMEWTHWSRRTICNAKQTEETNFDVLNQQIELTNWGPFGESGGVQ